MRGLVHVQAPADVDQGAWGRLGRDQGTELPSNQAPPRGGCQVSDTGTRLMIIL